MLLFAVMKFLVSRSRLTHNLEVKHLLLAILFLNSMHTSSLFILVDLKITAGQQGLVDSYNNIQLLRIHLVQFMQCHLGHLPCLTLHLSLQLNWSHLQDLQLGQLNWFHQCSIRQCVRQ